MGEQQIERARRVKAEAARLGFDACGIAAAGPADPEDRLGRWLAAGYAADMEWMAHSRAVREDVGRKMPGARSVIVVARNYYGERPDADAGSGKVACYAWGKDYHRVLRKPLRGLVAFLAELDPDAVSYASVDSGPVLERSWAERAGVGWIGKNSLVLRRDLGSWFFLATVITTARLATDAPVLDHCGTCRACIDACPTAAIVESGVIDSRRCLSYQTIENRGAIPAPLHRPMGEWLFGCDVCQEVCPWNRFAKETDEAAFQPREGVANPGAAALAGITAAEFDARFAGTPVRRAKHAGMVRNARIVLGNLEGG